jgi:signal transduction histidine kinase
LEGVTREEALSLLEDSAPRNRLRGARALQELAVTADYRVLREHVDREPDAHVRRALVRVIHRIRPEQKIPEEPVSSDLEGAERDLIDDVWAEATEEITGIFLHEISPLVGAVSDAARSELSDSFSTSRTSAAIDRLTGLVELVGQLRRAASAPEMKEFDLTDLVLEGIRDEGVSNDERVRPARDDPVVIVGAVAAVQIAFCNGLRNAKDAVDARDDPARGEVIINWGLTDQGGWIAILDNGIGLPEGSNRVFEYGLTTKPKSEHFGFGLSISRQAMQSAGGSIELAPRAPTGTAFVMRWPVQGNGQ